MMWNSVANLKESLSKMALDVHDDDGDEDLSIYTPRHDRFDNSNYSNSVSEQRISRNFTNSRSPTHSPIANGFESPHNHEIEKYKVEIKKLQESEAEIKALSVNYAALLKAKEDQILRLAEENDSLKQNLLTTNAALNASKNVHKRSNDFSPSRQSKTAVKNRSTASPQHNGLGNGTTSANGKELTDLIEEKNSSLAAMQATHEVRTTELGMELEKERDKFATLQKRLQEEQNLNASFQVELRSLKDDSDRMSKDMSKVHDELNQKISEIRRLQMELHGREREHTDDTREKLKNVISTLENEKRNIKKERDEFEAALKVRSSPVHKDISGGNEGEPSKKFPEQEEMLQSLQKLEKDLKETREERDKALQGLNRLKQHLLEKEAEESEKMDEDSKTIEELRETNEYQRVQILHLEKALRQAIGSQEEIKMSNNSELKKSKETIEELNRKLASYISTIEAKNMEVLNLQSALGQYYAEIEAKERLREELAVAKEESARLFEQLKDAHQQTGALKEEKGEILGKLSQAERMLGEGKSRVKKLEEDNEKLRRALEQSMTRLNRMSVDSDFLVDRRIVIKLLVTYFQRNHSKEVLDLIVRMLGFSDEDKQRIGIAQQGAGKGVVRGVLGLPGRLVGGIMGGGSAEAPTTMASEDQSFANLWVDFLLKETEEREKRESTDAANGANGEHKESPNPIGSVSPLSDKKGNNAAAAPTFSRSNPFQNQNRSPESSRGNFLKPEHSDSEFSTVPITSSESNSHISRLLPRY
ncbi:golgin candidate 4-like isoform X2 [Olea europaea var. sylvestris]|uniref:golgin candidate 4-like isoform X2 n=1 Tax=Olea europaea var. sylvestris TaxID=158386 RepID=UPI000C1D60D0|nr:golgin candidate 4-like isoform X2 [Olea europaea var. sylvestris]